MPYNARVGIPLRPAFGCSLGLAMSLALSSCFVTVSLDDKRCDDGHPCLDGYDCVAGVCVAPGRPVDGHDAGSSDAGGRDAGGADAGTVDAGSADAGTEDAGPVDGGADASDGGSVDAGAEDAGAADAGREDAGLEDAGDDAGPVDGGEDAGGGLVDAGFDAGPPPVPTSCADQLSLDPSSPTGVYEIDPGSGPRQVLCDMDSDGGGWTRVQRVDATDGECPPNWRWRENPTVCTRDQATGGSRSATFAVPLESYREVRGFARGLQKGNMDAFRLYGGGEDTIDDPYVDGLSLTVQGDGGREHVWSWAVGWSDTDNSENSICPCLGGQAPAPFVGEHFYCESGSLGAPQQSPWYTSDPLWDGDGTGSDCDTNGDPSWFVRTLPAPTSSALEVRLMADQESDNEDVGLLELELWVR